MTRLLLFLLAAAVQLGVIGWMLGSREVVLRKGQPVKFVVAPVDPYDPFRGRYVALSFPADTVEAPEDASVGDIVYAILDVDSEGYATVANLETTPPAGSMAYLEVTIRHLYSEQDEEGEEPRMMVWINLPFDRYYMNEHTAPEAERIYREALRDETEANARENYLVVKVHKGRAVAEQLVLRGEPL